ncbi:hypothetical protein NP493_675g00027 [Ridgeia piscesae]|uniref:Uncharacterized protein n=1 Tax=Ridgeia piscesae TaxID=27915 RepID=A0AAD9KRA4_RIDPI|nr:hypothetical protein NP493_675g00027 [Ridgeia piscesae]
MCGHVYTRVCEIKQAVADFGLCFALLVVRISGLNSHRHKRVTVYEGMATCVAVNKSLQWRHILSGTYTNALWCYYGCGNGAIQRDYQVYHRRVH